MLKNLHSFFRSFSGVKKKILRDSSGFFKSCAWDFPKIPLGCSRRTCGSSVAFCKTGAGFSLSVVIAGIPQIVAGSSPAPSMLSREGSNITANKRQFGRRGGMGGGEGRRRNEMYIHSLTILSIIIWLFTGSVIQSGAICQGHSDVIRQNQLAETGCVDLLPLRIQLIAFLQALLAGRIWQESHSGDENSKQEQIIIATKQTIKSIE